MKTLEIKAQLKKLHGTNFSRKIRMQNQIPAIIYGKKEKNLSITVCHNDILNNIIKNQDIKNTEIIILIDNKKNQVSIKKIQKHPFKLKILHIDFIRT